MGILGKSTFGSQDAFIMKLENNGIPVYIHQFGTAAPDACAAITGDNSGNIFVAGSTFGEMGEANKGFMDGFVGQFTENGSLVNYTQLVAKDLMYQQAFCLTMKGIFTLEAQLPEFCQPAKKAKAIVFY